jgi:hypothetical protein
LRKWCPRIASACHRRPRNAAGLRARPGNGLGAAALRRRSDGSFGGERSVVTRVTLVEDVVFTGRRALTGARALRDAGAELLDVLCLLDRQSGAAQLLAADALPLSALFTETELLEQPGQAPKGRSRPQIGRLKRDPPPSAYASVWRNWRRSAARRPAASPASRTPKSSARPTAASALGRARSRSRLRRRSRW